MTNANHGSGAPYNGPYSRNTNKRNSSSRLTRGLKLSTFILAGLALVLTPVFAVAAMMYDRQEVAANIVTDPNPLFTAGPQGGVNPVLAQQLLDLAGAVTPEQRIGYRSARGDQIRMLNGNQLPSVQLFEIAGSGRDLLFTAQQWRLMYITFTPDDQPIFTFWMNGMYHAGTFNTNAQNNYNVQGNTNMNNYRTTAGSNIRNIITDDFNALLNTEFLYFRTQHAVRPIELPGRWQEDRQVGTLGTNHALTGDRRDDLIWIPSVDEVREGGIWALNEPERRVTAQTVGAFGSVSETWLRSSSHQTAHGSQVAVLTTAATQVLVHPSSAHWVPHTVNRGFRPALHISLGDIGPRPEDPREPATQPAHRVETTASIITPGGVTAIVREPSNRTEEADGSFTVNEGTSIHSTVHAAHGTYFDFSVDEYGYEISAIVINGIWRMSISDWSSGIRIIPGVLQYGTARNQDGTIRVEIFNLRTTSDLTIEAYVTPVGGGLVVFMGVCNLGTFLPRTFTPNSAPSLILPPPSEMHGFSAINGPPRGAFIRWETMDGQTITNIPTTQRGVLFVFAVWAIDL